MAVSILKNLVFLITCHLTHSFAPLPNFNTFSQRSHHHVSTPQLQLQRLRSQSTPSQLMAFFNDNQDDEEYEDDYDDYFDSSKTSPESLENAREQFELMMAVPSDNKEPNQENANPAANPNADTNNLKSMDVMDEEERYNLGTRTIRKAVLSNRDSPPPLTAILKERRIKEIELLKSLHNSDATVSELWSLWISERGAEATAQIMHAEELISIESWNEAEVALLSLIEEYGIHWAEPVNRLATLYYMLGRYDEAKALCELVLDIKPWHFGALSGIVLVCTAKNDAVGARYWAEKRLPPAVVGERRIVWAENAVREAEQKLHDASLIGRSKEIGQEEIQFRQFRAQLEEHVFPTDAEIKADEKKSDGDDDQGQGGNFFDAWQ